MRSTSLGRFVLLAIGALVLSTLAGPAAADLADDPRLEVIKLGQVTGDSTYEAQLGAFLKDRDRGKELVAAGLKMAKAKDPGLTYTAAMILGQMAGELKDYEACENLFRVCMDQAVKLYSTQKILQSYGDLIDVLYDAKKYAQAVRVCQELLELKTSDATPRKFFFIVADQFGDFGFQEDPDFDLTQSVRPAIHQMMIQALAKEGKYDQALKQTDNLVRATDSWKERQLRGWVLREMGRVAEAAKVYEDVIERIAKDKDLTQKGKDAYSDRYRHVLSNIYVEAKQIDKAADQLKVLIDRHPDVPGYRNDLGYIWADNDMNLKEAEDLIRKALDLDRDQRKKRPDLTAAEDHDQGAYLDSLGWVLFKQKRYEDAKKQLLEAIKDKDAQHIDIFDHLGDTYLALGQREAALDAWRRGLDVAGTDRLDQERKAEVEKKIQKHKN
jgi:tetratricopeptide (TPR) repeat protein